MQQSLAQWKRRDKYAFIVNPLSVNPIKWSNTLKLYFLHYYILELNSKRPIRERKRISKRSRLC